MSPFLQCAYNSCSWVGECCSVSLDMEATGCKPVPWSWCNTAPMADDMKLFYVHNNSIVFCSLFLYSYLYFVHLHGTWWSSAESHDHMKPPKLGMEDTLLMMWHRMKIDICGLWFLSFCCWFLSTIRSPPLVKIATATVISVVLHAHSRWLRGLEVLKMDYILSGCK